MTAGLNCILICNKVDAASTKRVLTQYLNLSIDFLTNFIECAMLLIKNKKDELKDKQTLAQLLQTGRPTAFLSCFFTFLFLQVHILVHIHRV